MAALRRVICSGALRLLPSLSQRIRPQTVLTQSQTLTSRSQSAVLQSLRWYSAEKTKFDDHYYANLVRGKPVVLFMKGSPSSPMCGFSRLVVQILHMHGVEGYDHHDILEDVEFKEGMKKWSDWPTFPQLYINGEFVGGADIVLQMHQSGEFVQELKKIGHHSALLDQDQKN